MKQITGGITAAKGFQAAGIEAGIKYQNRKDMAIIYSEKPCVAAGTFTSNVVKAAPVKWDRKLLEESPYVQAVIVNTGIANAGTGAEGMKLCEETAKEASRVLGIPENAVLVGSTGVIGAQLPIDRIKAGISRLAEAKNDSLEAGTDASRALMTTYTVNKEQAVQVEIGGVTVTLGAMSKGSGMIHPNMGTMLAFITTDCAITHEMLSDALHEVVARTFNRVTVDGDTSTNDMCVVLANGMAGNSLIEWKDQDYETFLAALEEVCRYLSRAIAGDGEGASKLVTCKMHGARSEESAERLAKAVVGSSLVKAAMFGADANWGRVLCAMGYSKAPFRPEHVDVSFCSQAGSILVCKQGDGVDFDEDKAKTILTEKEVIIDVDLHEGDESAECWGCDLTYDYVKINGDYRT